MKRTSRGGFPRKRIFLDTNVILDFLLEREPFYFDALRLWAACEEGLVEGYVSALTVNNVHYIAHRLKSATTAMIAVRGILGIFNIVPLDREQMQLAADFHDRDFEDDIQLQSAIKAGCSHLFTRDPAHFRSTAIAIVPPSAFVHGRP